MNNKFTFGKYRGHDIKEIILTHIGYIMWCLENISNFSLNEEEQKVYDAAAICIKKYDVKMSFPVDLMYKHVKDMEAFHKLETPFTNINGYQKIDMESPLYDSVKKYMKKIRHPSIFEGELTKYFSECVIDNEKMADYLDMDDFYEIW